MQLFFLLGHKKEEGEADLPVPLMDLPQLRVNRQNLRMCYLLNMYPALEAVPSRCLGLGQQLLGGEKEPGVPMCVWVPAALPAPEAVPMLGAPLCHTGSPVAGLAQGRLCGSSECSAAPASPGDKVLLCPAPAVPVLNSQPLHPLPWHTGWEHTTPIQVSWAHSLGSFSWFLLSKLGMLRGS